MKVSLHPGEETDPKAATYDPRGDSQDCHARRLSGKKGRQKSRSKNPLAGLAARQGFRSGHRVMHMRVPQAQ